jgi:hypothetical protein
MGNTLMAQINLGKGGQVQYHSGNRSTTNHTPSERRSVFMKHVMESGVVTSQEELIALLDMIISTHLGIGIPT